VKPQCLQAANEIFKDTGVRITAEGQRHLGAALGSKAFKAKYAGEKVEDWAQELSLLAEFSLQYPHAAHAVFTKGFSSKVHYYLRTIQGMGEHLGPLDEVLREQLMPVLLNAGDEASEKRASSLAGTGVWA
jgi:hypothetical protein